MKDDLRARVARLLYRLRRIERRELTEFRRWLEATDNLVHVSALVFVPALLALVTALSNTLPQFSFLLFPPLASGTYTLFANPGGKYANPVRFVAGLTVGAACGWASLRMEAALFDVPAQAFVSPGSAAVSILLVGLLTWAFDVEQPSAFSSALLILPAETPWKFVGFIFLSSTVVAVVFALWRASFYEERAQFLYGTMRADDHVLVPLRGDRPITTALFGGRLAAAHEAGKVVLLDVVDDERLAGVERELVEATSHHDESLEGLGEVDPEVRETAAEAAARVNRSAERVRTETGVPVEVAVACGDPAAALSETARAANCDLICTPYEEDRGLLSSFVRSAFSDPTDAVAVRSLEYREEWRRVLVLVNRPGDTAHAMIDFATRLTGRSGTASVCTSIDSDAERRPAEEKLAGVVDAVDGPIETRVAKADVLDFVARNAESYDLVMLGASRERSRASRIVSPPTFERLRDLDTDVAVVDRGTVE